MTKKEAIKAYRRQLGAVAAASLVLLGTFAAMLWTMPAIMALGSAGAAAVLALTMTKTAGVFAGPLLPHARAVHIAATHNLRIGRDARHGVRAFRLYRHAAPAVRRRRAARRMRG